VEKKVVRRCTPIQLGKIHNVIVESEVAFRHSLYFSISLHYRFELDRFDQFFFEKLGDRHIASEELRAEMGVVGSGKVIVTIILFDVGYSDEFSESFL
jgi:hypothetical protein